MLANSPSFPIRWTVSTVCRVGLTCCVCIPELDSVWDDRHVSSTPYQLSLNGVVSSLQASYNPSAKIIPPLCVCHSSLIGYCALFQRWHKKLSQTTLCGPFWSYTMWWRMTSIRPNNKSGLPGSLHLSTAIQAFNRISFATFLLSISHGY